MPLSRRTSSVLNGATDDLPKEADLVTDPEDALAAAEEAEAEAAEAEAEAAAARARARAIRLRREAAASQAKLKVEAAEVEAAEDVDEATAVNPTKPAPRADEEEADAASEDIDDDAPEEELDAPTKRRLRLRLPAFTWKTIAASLVVLLSLALLGLSLAMYLQHRGVEAQRQQTAEFTAAARQGAVTLMSLDFNKAQEDVQRIIDNTTGDFKKDFQAQADEFIGAAKTSKVVTTATVTAVGMQKMAKDTGTALVTVSTQVSNAASAKQEPRSWRLAIDLTRDGDQLKMSKVEFVP